MRFSTSQKPKSFKSVIAAICIFAVLISVFIFGITSASEGSVKHQKETLINAINRTVTFAYATEGAYPESLNYIKENYGLLYNEDLFFVDYIPRGANLLPDITVIETGGKK